jgi:alkyl hydroperoxide reductase subunit AhpF
VLSGDDLQRVQCAASQIAGPVTIFFSGTGSGDPFETNLLNIVRQISGVSLNRIKIEEAAHFVFPGKPSLTLSDGRRRNIHYLAAPEGTEFSPFLDAVLWLGKGASPASTGLFDALYNLTRSVDIVLLIAALCPHCPHTVRNALAVAIHCPAVNLTVVDALQFSDLASRFKVKSTPTLIIDEGLTLVGTISLEEMVSHIIKANEPTSLTTVLESMINAGRAEDAARLICSRRGAEAVIPLYRSQILATRIGALLAMEEALETDPKIFDSVIDQLVELLSLEDVSLRGDTAEFLGKVGNPLAIPALLRIADDPDPDVRDAVSEALELLQA